MMRLLLAVLLTQCCWAQTMPDSNYTKDQCNITDFPIRYDDGTNVTVLNKTCIAGFKPNVKEIDLSNCVKVFRTSRDFAQTMDAHKVLKQLHDQSEVDKQDPVRQFIQLGQCAGSDELESDYNNLNTALQELGTECKLVEVSPSEEVQTPVKGTFDWLKDVPSFLLTVVRTMVSYLLTSELIWYVVPWLCSIFSLWKWQQTNARWIILVSTYLYSMRCTSSSAKLTRPDVKNNPESANALIFLCKRWGITKAWDKKTQEFSSYSAASLLNNHVRAVNAFRHLTTYTQYVYLVLLLIVIVYPFGVYFLN
jgi:hypothetical protein